jgi:agmatinase
MKFPGYFADAESDFRQAAFVLFGVPFGKTSSFRSGAEKGPAEIRKASWNFETWDIRTGKDFSAIPVHDFGDLSVTTMSAVEMVEEAHSFTLKLRNNKKIPVALGGEHSITPGIISAFPKDIAVLSLDAHLDFRDHYENQKYNHACVLRRLADHVGVKNIAVVGVRSAEYQEFVTAQNENLFFIDAFTFYKKGTQHTIKLLSDFFQDRKIYLTLDIDVIDPCYAPGTSTPEPFGLSPLDVLELCETFAANLIGFDMVEVCPPFDHGETSLLAAKMIRSLIAAIWNK